jgi:predicted polyphosphate/ATP-dependent NAD kinase
MPGPVGIIANPASGKDIRRLVAHASVFDNQEKRSIVKRAVLGAVAAGAQDFLYMPDGYRIVEEAVADLETAATFTPVETPGTGSAIDTTRAAAAMRAAGAAVIITLGGDGTNRAVVKGWLEAPLVAVSTGTNNVFPRMLEATVAGAAAGLLGAGRLSLDEVARQAKRIRVEVDGEPDDVALVDAVLVSDRFVAARAIWMPQTIRTIVLARAEPHAVGLSAVGGLLRVVGADDDAGLLVQCGEGGRNLLAPIAPGLFEEVPVLRHQVLSLGETVEVEGPGVIAVDGERERTLRPGQRARLTVLRDGPCVVDVTRVLALASCRGLFQIDHPIGGEDGD